MRSESGLGQWKSCLFSVTIPSENHLLWQVLAHRCLTDKSNFVLFIGPPVSTRVNVGSFSFALTHVAWLDRGGTALRALGRGRGVRSEVLGGSCGGVTLGSTEASGFPRSL